MSLEMKEVEVIIALVGSILKYGTPLVQSFIKRLEKDTITKEDLENMAINRDALSYFPSLKEKLKEKE